MWQVSHFVLSPGPWLQGYLCSDDLRGELRRSCAAGLLQEWLDAELREHQVCVSVCGRRGGGLHARLRRSLTHKCDGEGRGQHARVGGVARTKAKGRRWKTCWGDAEL